MADDTEPGFVLSVLYRGKSIEVSAAPSSRLGDVGNQLLAITGVAPNTLRLLIPQGRHLPARLIQPLSQEFSNLPLRQIGISEGKLIKMMGSSGEEIQAVLQPSTSGADSRIIGFSEEDERAKHRTSRNAASNKSVSDRIALFGKFRTLELPGIELSPPPSKAMELMHRLARDPGVIAVMKKHGWKVGIMSELAPEGYVGISPKCLLGFNKNHGEEISLRLRTDDLKGFRKYESIKKTLMHELAHMVYGEHDEDFHRLDKQLNKEVLDLDWTKGTKHTLSVGRNSTENMDEDSLGPNQRLSAGFRLGGNLDAAASRSAQTAAAAAALARLSNHQELKNMDNLPNHLQNSSAESINVPPINQQGMDPHAISDEIEKSLEPDPDDTNTTTFGENLVLKDAINERTTIATRLQREILKLKQQASPAEVDVVLRTLSTIIGNALKHPDDAKFHRLRMNSSFQQRVARFQAALEVLRLVGFSEALCQVEGVREECLILNSNDHGLLSLANSSIQTFLI
ncbi:hypothetical protein O6H91_17G023300 [Diphasiastrum complanatum]|uniref:Uncharacterized protein n=1 Tax=Diphasiastrum complanatum TaxID=34168 RepID=A0ACC2B516_DIPCM|nr:hypothetical protein O6H91_17G023300 [Diphasiastrum complanatum]